jgi:methanogenic corrinoid protein MtbC1
MISWCAYCQEFQGEVEPYHNFAVTHGLCLNCAKTIKDYTEKEEERVKDLNLMIKKIFVIGRHGDPAEIKSLVEEARKKGIKNSEILVGMISPALWEIGDLWARNQITFHDEHRFTFQMRKVLHHIKEQTPLKNIGTKKDVLLINTVGNTHTLGIEILDFWLRDKGIQSQILLWESFSKEDLAQKIELINPKILGISVAMPEQLPATAQLISFLKESLGRRLPKICVGGNALKTGSSLQVSDVIEARHFKEVLSLL